MTRENAAQLCLIAAAACLAAFILVHPQPSPRFVQIQVSLDPVETCWGVGFQ